MISNLNYSDTITAPNGAFLSACVVSLVLALSAAGAVSFLNPLENSSKASLVQQSLNVGETYLLKVFHTGDYLIYNKKNNTVCANGEISKLNPDIDVSSLVPYSAAWRHQVTKIGSNCDMKDFSQGQVNMTDIDLVHKQIQQARANFLNEKSPPLKQKPV